MFKIKNTTICFRLMPIICIMLTACRYGVAEYVDFDACKAGVEPFKAFYETTSNALEEAPWDMYAKEYSADYDVTTPEGMAKATSTDLISVVRSLVEFGNCKRVHQVAGTYMSEDVDGQPIRLSGKVFYPEKGDIKNIILVSHFTIGANFECPSEAFSMEGLLSTLGYLVIVPDYIGYGVTSDRIHPYLQADLTASNVLDMALAVVPWMKQRNIQVKDTSLILLGYSQGGATTLHVQRLIETEPYYRRTDGTPLFRIKRTYCGAGPYDVAQTYDYSIKLDKTGIPCAVPMIIQGMSVGMGEPLDMAYFFKEPLLSNYQEWLNSKKYTVKQINLLINVNKLSDILTEEGTNKSNDETQRLYRQLANNSISDYYVPSSPMYMFHSMDDQTVPFINSQKLQVQFDTAGCKDIVYDFDYYGDHTSGMLKFLIKCMQQL